jgi:hypothetical protein
MYLLTAHIPQDQGVQAITEVSAHTEVTEGEDGAHMVAEALAVVWGKTHGSGTAAGAVAAPDHLVEVNVTHIRMAPARQHIVEVNVAPKAKEHLDVILVQRNPPALTIHPQLLTSDDEVSI